MAVRFSYHIALRATVVTIVLILLFFTVDVRKVHSQIESNNQKDTSLLSLSSVVENVEENLAELRSVLYEVKQVRNANYTPPLKLEYVWGFSGAKVYMKRVLEDNTQTISVYDGKRLYEMRYGSDGESEQNQWELQVSSRNKGYPRIMGGPDPIEGIYRFEGKWLPEILKQGKFRVERGEKHKEFGTTVQVIGEGNDKKYYQFRFAVERDWMCVSSAVSYNTLNIKTDVTSMVANGERWLPSGLHCIVKFLPKGEKEEKIFGNDILKMEPVNLNHVPEELFTVPKFKDGLSVLDRDTNRRYIIRDGNWILEGQKTSLNPNTINTWSFLASTTPLISLVIFLGAAQIVRRFGS
jgi:hypothetical protein